MRVCLGLMLVAAGVLFAQSTTIQGSLAVGADRDPALVTPDHKQVVLHGDDMTTKVLHDKRLNGMEAQVKGHFTSADHFEIDPIHTHGLLIHKDGHLKMVTYWCDVCSIRAYTPGPCVCCQKETTLDLQDPDKQ